MRFWIILLLTASVCWEASAASPGGGAPGGTWPSLAKRPAEATALSRLPDAAAGAVTVEQTPVSDAAARLVIAARDVDQLEQRWQLQLAAVRRTETAGRQHADAAAEATAQFEAGRLDKLAGQIADARSQIETITGDLAVAAAAGADVTTPLRSAGLLLSRCAKLISAGTVHGSAGTSPAAPL